MEKKIDLNIFKKIILVFIWALYFFICLILIRIYLADVYYKKSQSLIQSGNREKIYTNMVKSISYNPYEPNYLRGRVKIHVVMELGELNSLNHPIKLGILTYLIKAQDLNPDNLVTIRNCIPLYYFLAVKDINIPADIGNIDSEYVPFTISFYRKVKEKYWNDVGVITSIAKYEKKLGFEYDYEISLERVKTLRPDLLEWNESFR